MKKLAAVIFVSICCLGIFGCATAVQKNWAATDGSRADATVKLSYEYYPHKEKPVVNEQEAMKLAVSRCKAWGYNDAEAFGGETRTRYYEKNLVWDIVIERIMVTKTYQCLGQGHETPAPQK